MANGSSINNVLQLLNSSWAQNSSSVNNVLTQLPNTSWTYLCVQKIIKGANGPIQFVGPGGQLETSFVDNFTWGVSRDTCLRYCNHNVIPIVCPSLSCHQAHSKLTLDQDFQFSGFASAFTNYLLPWLGLIAQLPTEAGSVNDGFISICLAVGSPALITYSLMLTIRNRYWVRQDFRDLRRNLADVKAKTPGFKKRLDDIQYVLDEAQQVPLRISQDRGWFSSLIVAPQNDDWWDAMQSKLEDTRRGVTLSLATQMIVAVLAWIFTIAAAFISDLGDQSTALQISAGNIWVWMVSDPGRRFVSTL